MCQKWEFKYMLIYIARHLRVRFVPFIYQLNLDFSTDTLPSHSKVSLSHSAQTFFLIRLDFWNITNVPSLSLSLFHIVSFVFPVRSPSWPFLSQFVRRRRLGSYTQRGHTPPRSREFLFFGILMTHGAKDVIIVKQLHSHAREKEE